MSSMRALLDSKRSAALMGILNRTPDSFSDGGRFVDEAAARARIDALVREGADLVDVGAESTRPGAPPVADDVQIARIGRTIEEVVERGVLASIDTTSPTVAAWALERGAAVVNSVSLEPAAELGALAARHGAALVLMHCRGSMTAMPGFSVYDEGAYRDVVAEVARELGAAAERAIAAGLPREDVVLDPGLGFAKNARQSLELVARLGELVALGYPVLAGPSRKSFLVAPLPEAERPPPDERLGGTIAASLACAARGAAVLRVHDVRAVREALAVAEAVERAGARPAPRTGEAARA
jgi:dihydropteroate synthase